MQKALWGVGGFAENLGNNTLLSLAFMIFGVGMGMNPIYIGIALSASRIIEAVTDLLMGSITDNTRSRWGRRRPWIFVGAILMAVVFAAIWFTPRMEGVTAETAAFGTAWLYSWFKPETVNEMLPAIYLIIMCSLFYMAFTVWVIPFSGLGLELVEDYDERTQLMTFRVAPAFIVGAAIGSLYKLTLMKSVWGGDEVIGTRYVCSIVAVLMLITGIIPAIFCRERFAKPATRK